MEHNPTVRACALPADESVVMLRGAAPAAFLFDISVCRYFDAEAVLWAVGATALVSFALTLFAMQSKVRSVTHSELGLQCSQK